jgi:hypothetical protein
MSAPSVFEICGLIAFFAIIILIIIYLIRDMTVRKDMSVVNTRSEKIGKSFNDAKQTNDSKIKDLESENSRLQGELNSSKSELKIMKTKVQKLEMIMSKLGPVLSQIAGEKAGTLDLKFLKTVVINEKKKPVKGGKKSKKIEESEEEESEEEESESEESDSESDVPTLTDRNNRRRVMRR